MKNKIKMFFHCGNCLDKGVPQYLAVGWTPKGLQVWCEECDNNVVALDFLGQKISYEGSKKES